MSPHDESSLHSQSSALCNQLHHHKLKDLLRCNSNFKSKFCRLILAMCFYQRCVVKCLGVGYPFQLTKPHGVINTFSLVIQSRQDTSRSTKTASPPRNIVSPLSLPRRRNSSHSIVRNPFRRIKICRSAPDRDSR